MEKRKLNRITAGFIVLVVMVLILMFSNSLRRSSHITLPEEGSSPGQTEDDTNASGGDALTDRVIREKHLTAMMVTHNLRYAVEYGDRILMMNRGRVVLDRAGAEKRATSMDDILTMFNQISLETGN